MPDGKSQLRAMRAAKPFRRRHCTMPATSLRLYAAKFGKISDGINALIGALQLHIGRFIRRYITSLVLISDISLASYAHAADKDSRDALFALED